MAPPPALDVHDGRLVFTGRLLPVPGKVTSAALSPDGKRIAYVVEDKPAGPKDDADFTSLWIVDTAPGASPRRLLAPRVDRGECPKACEQQLLGFDSPVWSLDGGFVYVLSFGWVTSAALHQVNAATGAERYVVDANTVSVIRNGRYRGMLLVGRHKYHPGPQYGSYERMDVVRPDGKLILTVPGSDQDEGDPSVANWLKAHGWRAN